MKRVTTIIGGLLAAVLLVGIAYQPSSAQTFGDRLARYLCLGTTLANCTTIHGSGSSNILTLPTGTDTLVGKATTDTLTNKTVNAESTGNVVTLPFTEEWPAAACQNGLGYPVAFAYHTEATDAPSASCAGTTATIYGALLFDDSATESIYKTWPLPSDWTGAIDLKLYWFTAATTGNVVWQVATVCVADNETMDQSTFTYNAVQKITDAAKGTASLLNTATQTGITTTGCSAGELLFLKIFRDPTDTSDTIAATADLVAVEMTYRRAM